MKNTLNFENLENVAGGDSINIDSINEEELRRLYEESLNDPSRPHYTSFEAFKNALEMKGLYLNDIKHNRLVPSENEELLIKIPEPPKSTFR